MIDWWMWCCVSTSGSKWCHQLASFLYSGRSGDVAAIFVYSPFCELGCRCLLMSSETEPHMWANLMEKVINVRKTNTSNVSDHDWNKYLTFPVLCCPVGNSRLWRVCYSLCWAPAFHPNSVMTEGCSDTVELLKIGGGGSSTIWILPRTQSARLCVELLTGADYSSSVGYTDNKRIILKLMMQGLVTCVCWCQQLGSLCQRSLQRSRQSQRPPNGYWNRQEQCFWNPIFTFRSLRRDLQERIFVITLNSAKTALRFQTATVVYM